MQNYKNIKEIDQPAQSVTNFYNSSLILEKLLKKNVTSPYNTRQTHT